MAPQAAQLGDELDDGPKITKEPADPGPRGLMRRPPDPREDDDGVDDPTPAVTSTPAWGGPLHHLQQTEGLPASVTVPSFVMHDNDATDMNFTFSEMGKTQSSQGTGCVGALSKSKRGVRGSKGLRGLTHAKKTSYQPSRMCTPRPLPPSMPTSPPPTTQEPVIQPSLQ